MSLTEENEQEKENINQPEREELVDDIPIFVLPDLEALNRENRAAVDNAAPIEEIPETNFEFSTFNPKPEKEMSAISPIAETPIESTAETMRKTGLAWSAAIVFFGSVVFMLILGWFADLLFGSSPWGIVVGIIFGSIIGFMQFFRITSRIINPSKSQLQNTPLKLNENPESPDKSQSENDNSKIF
jgi:F0F1-type ATP synthase assembly protein I